jgi:hypothetical protein
VSAENAGAIRSGDEGRRKIEMIKFIDEFTFYDQAVKEAYDTIKQEQAITQRIWGRRTWEE